MKHNWTKKEDQSDEDIWYKGTVVDVLDLDEYSSDWQFQVQYDGYENEDRTVVKLIKDWKEGWLKILEDEEEEEKE